MYQHYNSIVKPTHTPPADPYERSEWVIVV